MSVCKAIEIGRIFGGRVYTEKNKWSRANTNSTTFYFTGFEVFLAFMMILSTI